MRTKPVKRIPFEFVLDYLSPLDVTVKPMFGCYALYVGNKIMIILRERADHQDCNGVWIATGPEHHQSLRRVFSSMRSISIFSDGTVESAWQMLSVESDDFESSVIKLCSLIQAGDKRIGRIPKTKKKAKSSA